MSARGTRSRELRRWPAALVVLACGAVAAALALVAIARGGDTAHAASATVTVANFSFTDSAGGASTTTINVGDTVAWTWADTGGIPHSTTSTSVPAGASTWDSGVSPSPFSFGPETFTVAGTYTYICTVHPVEMTGTIVVQAVATATAVPPTNTAVAATSTPVDPTNTPVAAAITPAPTQTAPEAASPSPALIAPAPTTSSGGADGAALPRTGGGASGGRSRIDWTTISLAVAGVAAFGGAGAVRILRRR